MKSTIEVLSIEDTGDKVSAKTGKAYRIIKAHVILTTDVGDRQVGILNMPKGMETPTPGVYEAEFGIGVDFQTRQVGGQLIGLRPVRGVSPSPAAKAA